MIFPIWQPLFSSTHALADAIGKTIKTQATHTGTLDPLAEGVVVILTDQDRYAKGFLSDWTKTYHFSILWGLATDSYDTLGLVTAQSDKLPSLTDITSALHSFPQHYEQTIPPFSSRRLNGKSSFELAKTGAHLSEKKRQVTLEHFSLTDSTQLRPDLILTEQHHKISQIKGDFRQSLVLSSWSSALTDQTQPFLLTHHRVTASTGTYVRQIVVDLSEKIGIPATTWSIIRTRNGPYTKQDCVEVAELSYIF